MKFTKLLSLGALLLLYSCDQTQANTADTSSYSTVTKGVIDHDYSVITTPISDAEQQDFGYRINAHVLLGNNRCLARGTRADIVQINRQVSPEQKEVHIMARVFHTQDNSRCNTDEYSPVWQRLHIDVNGMRSRISDIVLNNVMTKNGISNISLWHTEEENTQIRRGVLSDIKVFPENGGVNPHFRAHRLDGKVLLGTNPCMAQGNTVELLTEEVRRTLVVSTRVHIADPNRVCTREYNPVYVSVSKIFRYDSRHILSVRVENVGEIGTRLPLESL